MLYDDVYTTGTVRTICCKLQGCLHPCRGYLCITTNANKEQTKKKKKQKEKRATQSEKETFFWCLLKELLVMLHPHEGVCFALPCLYFLLFFVVIFFSSLVIFVVFSTYSTMIKYDLMWYKFYKLQPKHQPAKMLEKKKKTKKNIWNQKVMKGEQKETVWHITEKEKFFVFPCRVYASLIINA